MKLNGEFPDLYRYSCVELKPKRLAFVATMAAVVGASMLALGYFNEKLDSMDHTFHLMMFLQTFVVAVIGTGAVYGSIYGEKATGTWDLQRMTPLTSFEIVVGKLAGAPLMAYMMCLALVPWTLWAAWLNGTKLGEIGYYYLALAIASFFSLSIGLLASSYSETNRFGTKFNVNSGFGALIGIAILFAGMGPAVAAGSNLVKFYGLDVKVSILTLGSGIYFGWWALLAAKWRIGSDLCEPGGIWRLPLFQILTVLFLAGLTNLPFFDRFLLLPVYGICLLDPGGEYWWKWRRRQRSSGNFLWMEMPAWAAGYLGAFGSSLLFTTIQSARQPGNSSSFAYIIPAMILTARDLGIVQAMKGRGGRLPEMGAVAVLALLYVIPTMLGTIRELSFFGSLFVPYPLGTNPTFSLPINILSGLGQLGFVAYLLRARTADSKPEAA